MDLIIRCCTTFLRMHYTGMIGHARLSRFAVHALEDLPKLLEEAYDVIFLHDTPWDIFHFFSVCRVIFQRFQAYYVVAR